MKKKQKGWKKEMNKKKKKKKEKKRNMLECPVAFQRETGKQSHSHY